MNKSLLQKLENLSKRYKKLDKLLQNNYKNLTRLEYIKFSKEYSNLSILNNVFMLWKKSLIHIKQTELLLSDIELKNLAIKELIILKKKSNDLLNKLKSLLIPIDPQDNHNCYIEIRAATGGDEAALFSRDLCKMYILYAELNLWKVEIVSKNIGEYGGYKEIILKIIGQGASGKLKFESGGHRVQRIPQTESQGRIHTSSCTVAVMPEFKQSKKIILKNSDLKIDTFRSSGAGGQHVNTTDSAVRITHIPTGCVVECQDERSQHKNKDKALSVLLSKIHTLQLQKQRLKSSLMRKNLLGTGTRTDRNRTYNFPKNRVTDHRINLTLYRLDEILLGNLDLLILPILQEYQTDLLLNI
ncbi:peptide chain release factor 1 [Buchnera aphidicola]|uniref:Peptide chain release factor 1 n=1 Tax=Buchnera aphidicola subsp. Tuberolachnus salignus TaxID=98804 RepID=A0A160SWF1_BUCTT|nr:peptide chain release factor 1 [Buchnera aphidicola]CUR53102.1 Peptide chain release factor 1 [Buchnera aphidicola (Tuberolachnus salignus)]